MTIKPGQSLGQYRIIEQIGKGGMATVFRATQPSLSREVAIKVLPDFFADDPAFHARFRQEAMAIAALRHPNILTVFDSGEADGVAYIVTELVDGGTLADKLGKPLPLDYCVNIATTIGSALDYAHSRGMIHRDIKPSNILLGTDGTPILSDFGLARMTGASSDGGAARLTATGATLGTPEYMAPEQISSSTVGPPADVYALAVTLYEMLTGSVPYKADSPLAVITARFRDPLPKPRERNPELSDAVEQVLLKGLADEPANRYATAGEMARALEVACAAPPRSAAAASPRSGGRPALLGVAAAALVIAGGVLLWSRPGSPPAADAAVEKAPSPSPTPPPVAAPAPTKAAAPPAAVASRESLTVRPAASTSDGLPPHGRLLYSLSTSAAEIAAMTQRPGDTIAFKDGALEFSASSTGGPIAKLPVEGIGDFVAVLRYVATSHQPSLMFRFHVTAQGPGYMVRIPAYLRLAPAATGARAEGPQKCCLPFDIFRAPQAPDAPGLFAGPQPQWVAAAGEEQVVVIAVKGPLITVLAGGQEIARVTDDSLGPGAMSISVTRRGPDAATLRLKSLDLYDAPAPATRVASSVAPELPPHGKLLYSLADHLSEMAQVRQRRPENSVAIKGKALELTVGGDTALMAALPLGGISDFVAVMRIASVNHKPLLVFRFQESAQGNHLVQIPAYLRLSPPAAGTRDAGTHSCCQDFDAFTVPLGGGPTLFRGPPPRSVAAPMEEEQLIVLAVKGPLAVVYADGKEIARMTFESGSPGGMTLQLQAKARQVPATVRVNSLEIYEAAAR